MKRQERRSYLLIPLHHSSFKRNSLPPRQRDLQHFFIYPREVKGGEGTEAKRKKKHSVLQVAEIPGLDFRPKYHTKTNFFCVVAHEYNILSHGFYIGRTFSIILIISVNSKYPITVNSKMSLKDTLAHIYSN